MKSLISLLSSNQPQGKKEFCQSIVSICLNNQKSKFIKFRKQPKHKIIFIDTEQDNIKENQFKILFPKTKD